MLEYAEGNAGNGGGMPVRFAMGYWYFPGTSVVPDRGFGARSFSGFEASRSSFGSVVLRASSGLHGQLRPGFVSCAESRGKGIIIELQRHKRTKHWVSPFVNTQEISVDDVKGLGVKRSMNFFRQTSSTPP